MNYLYIRPYLKDDYLARLCYESWMLSGYEGNVTMYAQKSDEYKWIMDKGNYVEREYCNNFGGQQGAWNLIQGLSVRQYEDDDIVISCDADLVVFKNPIDSFVADFGGVGGMNDFGFNHISGQCIIMRGWLVNKIISEGHDVFFTRWNLMDSKGIDIADDIYLSYCANEYGAKIQTFKGHWIHDKLYDYEPRTDFKNIIDELRNV